jgi:hypothetical protein
MNDYLWDRSGEADEDVRKLEELLGAFRAQREMPRFRARRPSPLFLLPLAAMLILGIALPAFLAYRASGWHAGAIAVYRAGDTIRATAPLRLETPSIGVVDVGAGTTLRIVEKRRLALDVGTIHARTTSPPGLFIVDTPRAKATDLGCEYVLDVAKDGSGSLRVTAGWVALTRGWTQSLVPRGASATFDAEGTLAPPVFDDASPEFKEAVRRHNIARVVALARTRDALTLINLFSRTTEEERLLVYDRLAQLVPPPAPIPRESMRWWTPGTTNEWWPAVLRASGVEALRKKKKVVLAVPAP